MFQELVDTATQGISVGIVLAFVVITLATKNVITGLLATLNIGVVTLSVVGLIPMAGWKLGVRYVTVCDHSFQDLYMFIQSLMIFLLAISVNSPCK